MPSFPVYPLINGHRKSWASIEAYVNGLPYIGFKSINWKCSLKPGIVRGTAPHKIGRTRGEYDATFDFEMYRDEADVFIATLGAGGFGYGEASFDTIVQFSEPTSQVQQSITTVSIIGGRITEDSSDNAEGTDASTSKFTCDAMDILRNGVSMVFPLAATKHGI
jgi:hypothetical protein